MSGGRGKGNSISLSGFSPSLELPGSGNSRSPAPRPWWSPVEAGFRLVVLVTSGLRGTRDQGRRSVLRSLSFPRRNLTVGRALLAIAVVGFASHLLIDLLMPPRPRYDLSSGALRIGSVDGLPHWPRLPGDTDIHAGPDLGMPATEFLAAHAPANPRSMDPFCDPALAGLDAASAEMARWLDQVAGICASGMMPLEIRERVLRILELRSALPMPELRLLPADRLREVVAYVSPLFPNNLGRLNNGDEGGLDEIGINRSATDRPYTGWFPSLFRTKFMRMRAGFNLDLYSRGWVADERLHGVMGMAAVNSLTAFEFKLLLSLEYVRYAYRHYNAAPPLARPALVLAGLATPAANFKFYNTAWIDALRRLEAELYRGLERADAASEERSRAVAYVESLRDEAPPMLVVEAVRLLRGHLAVGRGFTHADVRARKAALPRAPWQSDSIATLPRWDGAAPPVASQLSAKIAIVIPFHEAELHKIDHFLKLWPATGTPGGDNGVPVVMALNTNFGTPAGRVIRASLLKMWRRHKLEGVMPLYLLSLRQPSTNHYDGAALSFYQLLGFLGGFFPAMQLMETDVRPIRSDWVSLLVAAAVGACDQWWIKGSAQLCSPLVNHQFDKRGDFHINGNSMYALSCPAFAHLIRRAQAFYPPSGVLGGQCDTMGGCETTIEFGGGYDHVLYNYRMDPAHFHYIRRVLPKFQYTLAVVNYCEERVNATDIAAWSDQTALVHSKFHLYSPEEQILIEVFNKVLLRLPEAHEMQRYWPKLRYDTMTAADVLADLCQLIREKAVSTWEETIDTSILGFRWFKAKPDEATYHHALGACPLISPAPASAAAPKADSSVHWETLSRRGADGGGGPSKVPIQVHMSSLATLGCVMPVLAELGVVLEHSPDLEACVDYGHCLNNSLVDPLAAGVHFNLCGGSLASCQQFKSFVKTPLVVLLTGDGIQQDFDFEFGADGDPARLRWMTAIRHLGAAPNVVVVAADDYAAHRIAQVLKLAPKVARGWCGDQHNDAAVKSGGRTSVIAPSYMPARHEVLVWSQKVSPAATDLRKKLHAVLQAGASRHHQEADKGGIAGLAVDLVVEDVGLNLSASKAIRHPAIVVLPSGPHLVTLETVALYRLNIPLFVPSGSLMDGWFASRLSRGAVEGDAFEPVATWPGMVSFDSAQDLADRLRTANFAELSAMMVEHNRAERLELAANWTSVLSGVRLLMPDGTV